MTAKDLLFYRLLLATAAIGFMLSIYSSVIQGTGVLEQLISLGSLTNLAVMALASSQLFFSRSETALQLSSMTWQTGLASFLTTSALIQISTIPTTASALSLEWFAIMFTFKITPLLFFIFWWVGIRGKAMKFYKTLFILTAAIGLVVFWWLMGLLFSAYPIYFLNASQYGFLAVSVSSFLFVIALWFVAMFYWALARFTVPLYV